MNFFGLNAAPVNGSTFRVVLGAALVSAGLVATAIPTNTTPAVAVPAVVGVVTKASGVRNVFGTARTQVAASGSAEWVLATTAGAATTIRAVLIATNTDAYGVSSSVALAGGTIVRPGEATALFQATANAAPLRTAGASVLHLVGDFTDADPSVKRAGQSTTERDGYARPTVLSAVLAGGTKYSLPDAVSTALSDSYSSAIWIQGGRAVVACYATIEAVGAVDAAVASSTCYIRADATNNMQGEATSFAASDIQAFSSVARPANAEVVAVVAAVGADARLALRPDSFVSLASSAVADARLALRADASATVESLASAYANAIRPGDASTAYMAQISAVATRICMGESRPDAIVVVRAMAITNPTVSAPFERTLRVPAEDRVMRVPYENRSMKAV